MTDVKYSCAACSKQFQISLAQYNRRMKGAKLKQLYCSRACAAGLQAKTVAGSDWSFLKTLSENRERRRRMTEDERQRTGRVSGPHRRETDGVVRKEDPWG